MVKLGLTRLHIGWYEGAPRWKRCDVQMKEAGYTPKPCTVEEKLTLIKTNLANEESIKLQTCASVELIGYTSVAIARGTCLSGERLNQLLEVCGKKLHKKGRRVKDPKKCSCVVFRDIGSCVSTCIGKCIYCFAAHQHKKYMK